MRIIFTVHGYKPAYRIGGPIISVSSLAEKLISKGHQVTVFTTNSNLDQDLDVDLGTPMFVNGVEVLYFKRINFPNKSLPFLSYLPNLSGYVYAPSMRKQLSERIKLADLVHTHLPFIYPTVIAAKFAREYQKPLFYHQRGVFDPQRLKFRSLKKSAYIRCVELPILQAATTLIALTDSEVTSYRALGVNTKCSVIPNGINVENYRFQPINPLPYITNQSNVILFLGRLHPIKGADVLLEAFASISNKFPNAILVLAGPDENGLEKKFRTKAEIAGLNERVIFTGMVSGEEKLDLLARADLFCLPSMGEGFSMAVLEALASKTAVLISHGCHFDEVSKAGCGVVSHPTTDDTACALAWLLSQPNKLRVMGELGYQFVRENYSLDTITNKMINVYSEGIERFKKN
jgi:glycosyltransferase involved in cell wall biosynthesis